MQPAIAFDMIHLLLPFLDCPDPHRLTLCVEHVSLAQSLVHCANADRVICCINKSLQSCNSYLFSELKRLSPNFL